MSTNNFGIRRVHWRQVLLLIAAVASATIIAAVLLIATSNSQPHFPKGIQLKNSSAGTMQGSSVRVEQVPVDEHGVLRYTAVDGDTEKELSVEDWIRLVSDPSSSDLARSLTNILKVSLRQSCALLSCCVVMFVFMLDRHVGWRVDWLWKTHPVRSLTVVTFSDALFDHPTLHHNDGMRSQEAPYEAYRFETPGVSSETVSGTRFEFVLVEDADLARFAATPDPNTFADYLSSPSCESDGDSDPPAGCIFTNLGGDATLVAPRDWSPESSPSMYSSCYGHIANFVRGAPEQQVLQMWNTLGKTLGEKLLKPSTSSSVEISKPLWFSTAGDGVAWLHFRLDSRPKYYHYGAFRKFPTKNP